MRSGFFIVILYLGNKCRDKTIQIKKYFESKCFRVWICTKKRQFTDDKGYRINARSKSILWADLSRSKDKHQKNVTFTY